MILVQGSSLAQPRSDAMASHGVRDVSATPDRVEDLQIGMRHEAKGLLARLGMDRGRAQRDGSSCCCRASNDLTATDAGHGRVSPSPAAIHGSASADGAPSGY